MGYVLRARPTLVVEIHWTESSSQKPVSFHHFLSAEQNILSL